MRFRRLVAAFFLGTALVVAAGSAAAPAPDAWRPDPWVTAKIKILLMTAEEVSAFNVNVDTVDGRVTLHGKVPTEKEKARAEEIARAVKGVARVQNLLQVVPIDEVIPTAVRDDALRRSLADAFDSAPKLRGSDIRVKSVNQGVVLLSGRADSLMEHLEAIRVAASVDGVTRVATEVETGDNLYDTKLWRDAEEGVVKRVAPDDTTAGNKQEDLAPVPQADPPEIIEDAADGGSPGMTDPSRLPDVMTDASITATIKSRLLRDANVPALSINVDTNDGVVTLFGQAYDAQARKTAEAHARAVAGVVEVRNEIQIVDVGEPAEVVTVTDEELTRRVKSALAERDHLDDCNITVSVKDGAIILRGEVPDRELKHSAATIAGAVAGVRSVDNQLRVGSN